MLLLYEAASLRGCGAVEGNYMPLELIDEVNGCLGCIPISSHTQRMRFCPPLCRVQGQAERSKRRKTMRNFAQVCEQEQ